MSFILWLSYLHKNSPNSRKINKTIKNFRNFGSFWVYFVEMRLLASFGLANADLDTSKITHLIATEIDIYIMVKSVIGLYLNYEWQNTW
jgi:succinate-acetate transporter protein